MIHACFRSPIFERSILSKPPKPSVARRDVCSVPSMKRAKLARPGGFRVVAAESLAVKLQLLITKRSRQRAPNLTSWDRLTLGFCALFMSRERLSKMPVILKPSTLLQFHQDW